LLQASQALITASTQEKKFQTWRTFSWVILRHSKTWPCECLIGCEGV